jgi:hypothetical protein
MRQFALFAKSASTVGNVGFRLTRANPPMLSFDGAMAAILSCDGRTVI